MEEIEFTHHGKPFYAAVAIFALAAGCGFTYGTLMAPDPVQRLLEAIIAIVFLAGALQAGERLVRWQAVQQRSRSLSISTRESARTARNVVVGVAWLSFFVGALMHLSQSDTISGIGSDLQVIAGVLIFAAYCVADYCGERLRLRKRRPL
jgi:uncharacterized membrane protein YoaK (UPF0700 family)